MREAKSCSLLLWRSAIKALCSSYLRAPHVSALLMSPPGALLRISRLSPCSLQAVLVDRYRWRRHEAAALASFLLAALRYAPEHRATAAQCLQHAWLHDP